MKVDKIEIPVSLSDGGLTAIHLIPEQSSEIVKLGTSEANEYGEAPYQIFEASSYEYSIGDSYKLQGPAGIIRESKLNSSSGRIVPNTYVGTIELDIVDDQNNKCGNLKLEVRSIKTSYRTDYRTMLEEITDWCTELLLQYTSPATQHFTVDFDADAATLYQRFAFIKSLLDSSEFREAVHRIIAFPATAWEETTKRKDIRSIRRVGHSVIKQLVGPGNRMELPESHSLKHKIKSVPLKVDTTSRTDTVDTPENRFIKHALETFQKLCSDFKQASKIETRLHNEAKKLEADFGEILSHSFFSDISPPDTLPLNSPLLQRKEGYREVLRTWLMFDLAAKLTWKGGDDVYKGGKRNVAALYEYWVFFKMLDIVKEVFEINPQPTEDLIEATQNELSLKLKSGSYFPIKGVCESYSRKLNVQFSFNKTFQGRQVYPNSGSWSENMRPDYTLSIWPYGIDEEQAEKEELIVHIHFDAKYKVKNLDFIADDQDQQTEESNQGENREEKEINNYKRVDLLKMHAYRDAIRRTGGAYILYPGNTNSKLDKSNDIIKGFHEIIPGLGAFTLHPSKNDDGSQHLRTFLLDVLKHFLNRASQREEMSFHKYDIYQKQPGDSLEEKIPETFGKNRSLIPDKTNVLVAYYKGKRHLQWIKKHGLYNARTGDNRGALKIGTEEAGAKFLLLHTSGETTTNKLLRIVEPPEILPKQSLIDLDYPTDPTQDYYLVFKVAQINKDEFKDVRWNIKELPKYKGGRASAVPFSTSLTHLMKSKVNS